MAETLRETIISSETADRMLDRVSPIYDNSYVGLWMFEAIGREYDKAWYIVRTLPEQLFPETVTWAIELWERRYAITPQPSQTIEERRAAILAARTIPAPFTPAVLEKFIYNLTGRSSQIVSYVRPYTFGVYIENTEGMKNADVAAIVNYINKNKHSHMSYDLVFQSSAEVIVGIETGYWRFPYRMTGTAKAGQLPQANILFEEREGKVVAASSTNAYRIPYMMAGIHPDINVAVSLVNADVDVDAEAQPHLFTYPAAGNTETGEKPEYTMTGSVEKSSIRASPSGEAFSINYALCGTMNAGAGTL